MATKKSGGKAKSRRQVIRKRSLSEYDKMIAKINPNRLNERGRAALRQMRTSPDIRANALPRLSDIARGIADAARNRPELLPVSAGATSAALQDAISDLTNSRRSAAQAASARQLSDMATYGSAQTARRTSRRRGSPSGAPPTRRPSKAALGSAARKSAKPAPRKAATSRRPAAR